MTTGISLGGYPEAVIPPAAVYDQDPGPRPDQITDFSQLHPGVRVVRMGPGRLITPDESSWEPDPFYLNKSRRPEVISYVPDIAIEGLTIVASQARLAGGFSLAFDACPEKYSQVVADPDSIVAFGSGESEGGYQGGTSRSLLNFTRADLGMEPYLWEGKVVGWSVFYLRRAQPGEQIEKPAYNRQPLAPQDVVERIAGTRLMFGIGPILGQPE